MAPTGVNDMHAMHMVLKIMHVIIICMDATLL